jgi:hypothetical protein
MRGGKIRGTVVERLARVKPSHGAYALARDAIEQLKALSEATLKRERDEALAERTSLLDRISKQKQLIAELDAALNRARAA